MNSPTCEATYNKVSIVFRIYRHNMQVHSFYICDKRERERERGYSVWNFNNFCCPLTNSYLCYLLLHNNERRWIHLHLHSKRIKCIWIKISLNIPYPHSQFGTQVSNNYFNYCKVILQLEQYFDQFWGSCIAIVAIQLLVLHLWACV